MNKLKTFESYSSKETSGRINESAVTQDQRDEMLHDLITKNGEKIEDLTMMTDEELTAHYNSQKSKFAGK